MSVDLYGIGIVYASACAEMEMTGAEVATVVNRRHPIESGSSWAISDDPKFASGETNPCPCNDSPGTRRHWLLSC